MKTLPFHRLLLLLCATLVAPACISLVSEDKRPCPCAEGWTCCEGMQVCVREAALCESRPGANVDTTPPAVPTLQGSLPGSPTAAREVQLDVVAEPSAQVRIFADAACDGAMVGQGVADGEGRARVLVTLADNATTGFHARAWDAAGNASQCSSLPLVVTHDALPPAVPAWSTTPASPSFQHAFSVTGTTEAGARVRLYREENCAGAPYAEGVATAGGAFDIALQATANGTLRLTANAMDAVGNVSACTEARYYVHDNAPPAVPVFETASAPSPSRVERAPSLYVRPASADTVAVRVYPNGDCQGDGQRTATSPLPNFTLAPVSIRENTAETFSVRAEDAAGNLSACSIDTLTFQHVTQGPGWEEATSLPNGSGLMAFAVSSGGQALVLQVEERPGSGYVLLTRHQQPDGHWSEPHTVAPYPSYPASIVGMPMLAAGGQGRAAMAMLKQATSGARAALDVYLYEEGAGWTPAERMATSLSTYLWEMALAVDEQGRTLVAWVEDTTEAPVRVRRHVPGLGWEPTRTLMVGAGTNSIQLAARPDGEAVLTWRAQSSGYAARFQPDTGWSEPVRLTPRLSSALHVGLDASGRAFAAWHEQVPDLTRRLFFSRQERGGGWTPAQPIAPWVSDLSLFEGMDLAVNGRGEALVSWMEGPRDSGRAASRFSRFSPETEGWSPPVSIPLHADEWFQTWTALSEEGTGHIFTIHPFQHSPRRVFGMHVSSVDAQGRLGRRYLMSEQRNTFVYVVQHPSRGLWVAGSEGDYGTAQPIAIRRWRSAP